ncbi:MAG: thioredoxin domain-containing protein [Myxococcales bacterium]|nr:thioredoxin domain-containing protein [Myxococcales bacterium]
MPGPRPSLRLFLGLLLLTLPACKRDGDSQQPDGDGGRSAGDPDQQADSARSSIGKVRGDEELEPDPQQLAAGVPYLRFHIELGEAPTRGPADAPVTIVMFSDFECPYCETALETVAKLEEAYPGKIRFAYKAFPLNSHPYAMEAALIGYSVHAQGKFWDWHNLVFAGPRVDQQRMEGYLEQLGLDQSRIAAELASLKYAPAVRRDLRTAKRLRLTSTPVFFINGRPLPGARPQPIFEHMVEQELSLAEGLATQGVAAAELYDYVTRYGYTAIVYEDERPSLDEDTVYPVAIGDAPARGRADAPITIVAFSDFQCPFCAKGHLQAMEPLREIYGDDIRFVFKHFPLPGHPLGALASRASFAARDAGKFWEFHDAVFAKRGRYSAEDLLAIADELQIPRAAMEKAMIDAPNDAAIEADLKQGVGLGITGTPAYFINGRPIVGAVPLLDFRMLIAEEYERVAALRAKGVAPADLYNALTGLEP